MGRVWGSWEELGGDVQRRKEKLGGVGRCGKGLKEFDGDRKSLEEVGGVRRSYKELGRVCRRWRI